MRRSTPLTSRPHDHTLRRQPPAGLEPKTGTRPGLAAEQPTTPSLAALARQATSPRVRQSALRLLESGEEVASGTRPTPRAPPGGTAPAAAETGCNRVKKLGGRGRQPHRPCDHCVKVRDGHILKSTAGPQLRQPTPRRPALSGNELPLLNTTAG